MKRNSLGPEYFDGVVSTMNGETHIHTLEDTILAPYCRFYERISKKMWDETQQEMVAKASIVWAQTGVPMVDEKSTVGGWLYVIPEDLPIGWYDVIVYEQAGASPASTDTQLVGSRVCYIDNSGVFASFDER